MAQTAASGPSQKAIQQKFAPPSGAMIPMIPIIAAVVLILVAIIVAVVISQPQLFGLTQFEFKDAPTVFAIVSLTAVGIERLFESLWAYVDVTQGSWWPLNMLGSQLHDLFDSLDGALTPFYDDVSKVIDQLKQSAPDQATIQAAEKELETLRKHIDTLKTQTKGNGRAQVITDKLTEMVDYLQGKYPQIKTSAGFANNALNDLSDFVKTFKDHPGRRLVSIYFSIIIGLLVAGVLRLNLLQLVVVPAAAGTTVFVAVAGVLLTGVVMGLGASPAHEVIKVIQEYKQSLKSPKP